MAGRFAAAVVIVVFAVATVTQATDDVNPLDAVVQQLTQKLQELEAKVNSQGTELQKLSPSVAFSVQHSSNVFNVYPHTPIVFDHVLLNLGGGYSAVDGEFTAPTSGLYHVSFRGWSNSQNAFFLHLKLNGQSISELPVGDESHENASSQSLVLQLRQGDVIFIDVASSGTALLRGDDRSTFMGYLLKAD